MSFQVQVIKRDYLQIQSKDQTRTKQHASTTQAPRKHYASTTQVEVLSFCSIPKSRKEIHNKLGIKNRKYIQSEILKPLQEFELLVLTIPNKPNSPNQKYITTKKGKRFLAEINNT